MGSTGRRARTASNGAARSLRAIGLLGVGVIAGCSVVPDAVNPVEWYKSAERAIAGGDTPDADASLEPATGESGAGQPPAEAPGSDPPFPTLADVPQRPQTSTPEQRAKLAEGLIADHERARRYSDEDIRLQGTIERSPVEPAAAMATSVPTGSDLEPAAVASPVPETSAESSPSAPGSPPPGGASEPLAATSPVERFYAPAAAPQPTAERSPLPSGETAMPEAPPPPPAGTPAAMPYADRIPWASAAEEPPVEDRLADELPAEDRVAEELPPAPAVDEPSIESTYPPPPPVTAAAATSAVRTPMRPDIPQSSYPSAARPTDVRSIYQARLRDPIPQGVVAPLPTANALPVRSQRPIGTVVVSSRGIESYRDHDAFAPSVATASASRGGPPPFRQALPGPGAEKIATILFDSGSAGLRGREKGILRQVAGLQRDHGGMVRIVGHSSSRTANMNEARRERINQRISLQRAESVARELERLGVPEDRITVAAVADSQPLYYEVMPSGESGNRRAEIYFE